MLTVFLVIACLVLLLYAVQMIRLPAPMTLVIQLVLVVLTIVYFVSHLGLLHLH